jgi:hypothetical protein
MNEVINTLNKQQQQFAAFADQTHNIMEVVLISEYLQETEISIKELKLSCKNLIEDIVNAGMGKVTPQLLPLTELENALEIAIMTYRLTPIFHPPSLDFYYNVMDSILTEDNILVSIPMKSTISFRGYEVQPFPMEIENKLVMLDSVQGDIIISEDFSLVDVVSKSQLQECHSAFLHLLVCPAYLFAFKTPSEAFCPIALAQKNTQQALSKCTFRSLTNQSIFHSHFFKFQYLYFPNEIQVTLICPDTTTHGMVKGYYKASDSCEIRSHKVVTLPNKHHLIKNLSLSSNFQQITFLNKLNISQLSVISEKIELLSLLNDSAITSTLTDNLLPVYLGEEILFPTFLVPCIILVVCTIIILCCIRIGYRRYKLLSQMQSVASAPKPQPSFPAYPPLMYNDHH